MAKRPLFSSAPRLQIKINGNPVAYAVGLNMNMGVQLQPVSVIGAYSPVSYEPTLVNLVSGSMQIVKLLPGNVQTSRAGLSGAGSESILQNNNGNTAASSAISGNSVPEAHGLQRHLDPRFIMLSETFDITLKMTQVAGALHTGVRHTSVSSLTDSLQGDSSEQVQIQIEIRDCRLTGRSANLSLGQMLNETVNFEGLITNNTDYDADAEDSV